MSELRKEQLKALVNADLEFFETLDAGLATFFSHMICVFLYNLMVARIRVHRIIAGKSK
jgi:hypothetical protein